MTAVCRETEASWWEKAARGAWEHAGGMNQGSIEGTLGSLDQLTGRGTAGTGVVIDMLIRRVVPGATLEPANRPADGEPTAS